MIQKLFYFLLLTLLLVACGGTKTPQLPDPSPTDTPPTDEAPLSPPLWVTITPSDGQVALRWQANTDADLAHYVLYWGDESGSLSDSEEVAGTLTEHVVTDLTNGTNYFFALTAVDAAGNTSLMSTEVSATPEALPEPPAPPPPAEGDFSASTLESLSIQKGQGKPIPFSIARNNFADEITVTLKNAPDGVTSDLPKGTTGDELVATITVDNSAVMSAGDYTLEFEASSGGLSKTLEVTLTVTEAPAPPPAPEVPQEPEITGVMLEGYGESKQVRQGQENFVIRVAGTDLGGVTNFEFNQSVFWEILENSNTLVRVKASVPHGSATNGIHLSLSTSVGSATFENAFSVTPITASLEGNNETGRGTSDLPFRSLSQAISVADAEDNIYLENGLYTEASGEQFPLEPANVTITGETREGVVIQGNATADCMRINSRLVLSQLTLRNCENGITVSNAGPVHLRGLILSHYNKSGVTASGAATALTIEDSTVRDALWGIVVYGDAQVSLENSTFNENGTGIQAQSDATIKASNIEANDNTTHGLYVYGENTIEIEKSIFAHNGENGVRIIESQEVIFSEVSVVKNAEHGILLTSTGIPVPNTLHLELQDSDISQNMGDGINVNGDADDAVRLELNGVDLKYNGESGIEYRSQNVVSKLSMVESTVRENGTHGLYIAGKPAAISLGFLKPANNVFVDNSSTYLVDARDANSGPITAYGTNFASGGILVDETGLKNGADSALPRWQIVNVGNSINFGAAE